MIDEGNPGGGMACSTGALGVCDAGVTACVSGMVACDSVIVPGMQPEVCGNGEDEDCDGALNNACPDTDGDLVADWLGRRRGRIRTTTTATTTGRSTGMKRTSAWTPTATAS
jgi:hypothetical protein